MELEKLLAPISQDMPCGPDLDGMPDYSSLEQDSKGKPERVMGDKVVQAVEPDWSDIKVRAEALFPLTKDLRVAILFLRANTRLEGLLGFSSGLKLIHEMLARYWENVHPCLDPDDDNDPTMRLNVLTSLEDSETLVRDLRTVKFICASRHTQLTIRDILVALGKLSATGSENAPNQAEIENILISDENKALVQAMQDALQTLDEIKTLLGKKVAVDRVPDFKPLYDTFKMVLPLCTEMPETEETQDSDTNTNQKKPPTTSQAGEIRSREDVVRVLEKACNFIERTEPTNPAPLLIRRAQYLMAKNFVEIIEELGPDWLKEVQRISGHGVSKK